MQALAHFPFVAQRRDLTPTLVPPARAAKGSARKRLICRWRKDPDTGRLFCEWREANEDEALGRGADLRLAA